MQVNFLELSLTLGSTLAPKVQRGMCCYVVPTACVNALHYLYVVYFYCYFFFPISVDNLVLSCETALWNRHYCWNYYYYYCYYYCYHCHHHHHQHYYYYS